MITQQQVDDLKAFSASPIAALIEQFEKDRLGELTDVVLIAGNSMDSLVAINIERGMALERREGTIKMAIAWAEQALQKQKGKK